MKQISNGSLGEGITHLPFEILRAGVNTWVSNCKNERKLATRVSKLHQPTLLLEERFQNKQKNTISLRWTLKP